MGREARDQEPSDRRLRRRRLRMAGERLAEDSSLRDALDDDQASQLLDWGVGEIKVEVARTIDLDDEEAATHLDRYVEQVRNVMHEVNEIMDHWTNDDPAGHWQALLELNQALRPWSQHADAGSITRDIFTLGQSAATVDSETLFNQLMTILGGLSPKREENGE